MIGVEKRIRAKRSFSNDSCDGTNGSRDVFVSSNISQGFQLLTRSSTYNFISESIQDGSKSTSDSVENCSSLQLCISPYRNRRKSISNYFRWICQRSVCTLCFLCVLILSALYYLNRSVSNSLQVEQFADHGSVLRNFGKLEEIKLKLKEKDKLQSRGKVLGEAQQKVRYESEQSTSLYNSRSRWNDHNQTRVSQNLRGMMDDLLIQLVNERKQVIAGKLRAMNEFPAELYDSVDPKVSASSTQLPFVAPSPEHLILSRPKIDELINKLRYLKQHEHVVMESNMTARLAISHLQSELRKFLLATYGPEPYRVEMQLQFPPSMEQGRRTLPDIIIIQLAPIELVPYSVFYFLEIIKNWKGGAFHRRAGHVLQAMVNNRVASLAFQEYHQDYPHVKFTLGYAGRPGGPEFYISTVDNSINHGPGSQGSKTEADSCFGKIVEGFEVVKRMQNQPGAGPSGFINDPVNYIRIISLKLLPTT